MSLPETDEGGFSDIIDCRVSCCNRGGATGLAGGGGGAAVSCSAFLVLALK